MKDLRPTSITTIKEVKSKDGLRSVKLWRALFNDSPFPRAEYFVDEYKDGWLVDRIPAGSEFMLAQDHYYSKLLTRLENEKNASEMPKNGAE